MCRGVVGVLFFLKYPATTEIDTHGHTLSLHAALPICRGARAWATAALAARRRGDACVPMSKRCCCAAMSRRGSRGSRGRSEEHTSELQSLMRISYAVFCLKKKISTP